MHPNPAFRAATRDRNLDFVRSRAFGILAIGADTGPVLSHVPFLLDDDGTTADLHLVRSNPLARLVPGPAVIAVSGPDGYVSPDWYGVPDQVPTWNYVAVHLRGQLEALPVEALQGILARQSAAYEARLAPKPLWTMDKMTPVARDRMLRMILPFRFRIDTVDGTWKLSQNKPDDARLAAADELAGSGIGTETSALARLMEGSY